MTMADSPRRSKSPKKKSWYALVPEQVELSPSRSCSPSSSKSSRSASPAPSSASKTHGILEYSSLDQVSTLEEGSLSENQSRESVEETEKLIVASKPEEIKSSDSHSTEYVDAIQSQSVLDATDGITRESFPLEEGVITQESSSSLDLALEPSVSEGSHVGYHTGDEENEGSSRMMHIDEIGEVSLIISNGGKETPQGEERNPLPEITDANFGHKQEEKERKQASEYQQLQPHASVEDRQMPAERMLSEQLESDPELKCDGIVSSQTQVEMQEQEINPHETDQNVDSLDQKYLQVSTEQLVSQVPLDVHEEQDDSSTIEDVHSTPAESLNEQTLHDVSETDNNIVDGAPQTVGDGDNLQLDTVYSHQDSQNSTISGSLSVNSLPEDQRLRGSQVQLPLDLKSLQPMSKRPAAANRSGVLLSNNQDEIDGGDKQVGASSAHSLDTSTERKPASSYMIHYPPELQSRPTSALSGSRDSVRGSASNSRLIRPSDLYGSPRGQDLEDSLARKVAQLLIESGQIAIRPEEKKHDRSKVSSKSSSCSGSPDSIEGSLTPPSQKDFPEDIFERRDSLNRERTPGRESPASSVSTCTDSLALHVQQLLKESEHLRARAPGRDAGYGSRHQSKSDAADLSVASTSSSVRRIINRVRASVPGTDSDVDVESGQDYEGQAVAVDMDGRENPSAMKGHSGEYWGSGHGSPRSQGRGSPFSESGRESPHYLVTSSRHSPSRVTVARSSISQGSQERSQPYERSHSSSQRQDSLSQRVQHILANTEYVESMSPRYHSEGASRDYQQVNDDDGSSSRYYQPKGGSYTYQTQDGIPMRRLHSADDGDTLVRRGQQEGARDRSQDLSSQDLSSTYQCQEVDSSREVQAVSEDAESLTRRVQAILMEDAREEESVDHQEAGVTQGDETEFKPVPRSNSDSRLASFHTAALTIEDEQPEGVGNFVALERARAVLEQQLQKVSERTFDHSITWETPMKHRRGSGQSHKRGPSGRPVEAWTEPHDTQTDKSQQRLSDPQDSGGGYSRSENTQEADRRYYSFPSSEVPSESDQRIANDGHHASSGARPRSYPQADSTRVPSYHRSQSTPNNHSGIPRRTFPSSTSSSGSRFSHGRSSSLGKSSDFTSQLPISEGHAVDQVMYTSPSQRPLSATLPRMSDHSRRSTIGSSVYSGSGSTPSSSSVKVTRGTSPERNILQPYRPPGSAETMYTYPVDRSRDRFSSTINTSSTTMESTHTGSDDAQPPNFPPHVLGSRKDSPRKNGSMIPMMSSTDYGGVPTSGVKGHKPKDSTLVARRDSASDEIDRSVLLGQDEESSRKPPDSPLDLSRSRRRDKDSRPTKRLVGRTSPSQLSEYHRDPALPERETEPLDKDIHYARLPLSQTATDSTKGHERSQGGYPAGSRKTNIPGLFSRKVLTDVLLDEGDNSAAADDMWRQYQRLKERKQETEGISGTPSIDESRIQKLTSLIKDPVGHTARNIARDVEETEFEETVETREDEDITPDESLKPKTRGISTLAARTDDYSAVAREPRRAAAAQTSFAPIDVDKDLVQTSELQPAKRQKTSRIIPPTSSIPTREMRPMERVVARALTPTKRKAVTQDTYRSDLSETNPEAAALSDLSLDSEQLLLLLGSHGVNKLSSKLLHLQQRIEKQKEHHWKHTSGQKSRKPKHVMGKKKSLPRPTHASTPAVEPDSELMKELAGIVQSSDGGLSASTVSSLTGTTQRTSDQESVSGSTSESIVTIPRRGERLKHRATKDDSEVEYRPSETESDVSVLCSCRPTLRRPKSAQESRRREAENGTSRTLQSEEVAFRRPVGVAPRASSKIPLRDKSNSPRIPAEDNRNHNSSSVPAKRFPRGTAFTIDLSQQTEDADKGRETSMEKGVLTDLPEKAQDRRKTLVEKRASKMVHKKNITPRLTPPGIAWFQPFSKRMPWHEVRPVPPPRPRPIIISALHHDPRTGKLSLQDAFLRHRPDFISQCRERLRKMKLAADERHVQESLELERIRIFEEQKAKKVNPLAHPYSDHLHKPGKRNLTRKEMKLQTQKIYSRLPEVVRKKEETKKIVITETNRLRAQIYRKKLSDRLKSRWPPE